MSIVRLSDEVENFVQIAVDQFSFRAAHFILRIWIIELDD